MRNPYRAHRRFCQVVRAVLSLVVFQGVFPPSVRAGAMSTMTTDPSTRAMASLDGAGDSFALHPGSSRAKSWFDPAIAPHASLCEAKRGGQSAVQSPAAGRDVAPRRGAFDGATGLPVGLHFAHHDPEPVEGSRDDHGPLVNALHQYAQERRQFGDLDDAIHELRKVLLIAPYHQQAQQELQELESMAASLHDQAIDEALARLERRLMPEPPSGQTTISQPPVAEIAPQASTSRRPITATPSATPSSDQAQNRPVAAPAPRHAERASSAFIRVPDSQLNGVQWFYAFGPQGKPDDGALREPFELFVAVPRSSENLVKIRVLDADTRDRHDEMDGKWNTSTAFRVLSGSTLLDSRLVGPSAPDHTTLEFGPFSIEQGELHGDQAVFRIEAECLEGDDNNLFAFEVSPSTAQCYALQPAIRLAEEPGAWMQFFPEIPDGTTDVLEENYDLDPDGGRIVLVPSTRDGRRIRSIPVASSASGRWASTAVVVPPETDGTRWTYRLIKGTQRKGNMSFRLTDQDGQRLPIYLTPGKGS